MRYLILAALLLSQTGSADTWVVIPPGSEYAPCERDTYRMTVLMPDGTELKAMRVQVVEEIQYVLITGYAPRLFCDGMGD
jgi:hypothetical protein